MSLEIGPRTLSHGLKVEARIVGALMMRELHTRFGRDNIGYLWVFLEPLLLATGIAVIHKLGGFRPPFGMDVVPFYVSGYTSYILFRTLVNRAGQTVESNATLLFHRHITLFDLLLARALLDTVAPFVAALLLLSLSAALGLGPMISRPLIFMGAWLLNFWFVFSLSMLSLAGCVKFPTLERFIHPGTYLVLPISGVFLILEQMPPVAAYYCSFMPLAHINELMRMGVFSSFDSPYLSIRYLVTVCMVLTLLGLISLRPARRHVEME